jgi:imidazolonepropionase
MMLPPRIDSLWLDCHLATMAENQGYGLIEHGAIAVERGNIVWIGPEARLPGDARQRAKKVYRLNGHWVTPGLVDCHTHLVYAGDRADEFEMRLNGASYQEIAEAGGGILSTVRAVRAATEDELYSQSLPRIKTMLAGGVTTLEIKSGYGLDLQNELKMLNVIRRLGQALPIDVQATFLGAHALPPEYKNRPDEYIDRIVEEMIPQVVQKNLASAIDAFCEKIAFSASHTERVFRSAAEHGLRIKLHAEQLSDSKGALLASRYKALSVDHLEYLAPEDAAGLAEKGCVAVLLPAAFYFLNETRKPPVAALRKAGVSMAVSTDGNPGTSPCFSLPTAMNMACVLFELTPAEALAGATRNAAKALGLQQEIGTLECGKAADFAIWEIRSPAVLAYHLGGNPLRGLVKRGNICRGLQMPTIPQ